MKLTLSLNKNQSTLLCLGLLLAFCFWAVRPLLQPGFFTMHDDQQIVRLSELHQALAAGQFPVRWVSNLGFGYGYPLFIFYPPLVYYLGYIFFFIGFSYIASIKLVFAAAFILSATTMFFWARAHFGNLPAIIAGLFYTYAPYHAVDAYVRGALAELFAFVWLPLILLSIDKLLILKPSSPRLWGLVLSFSYALLMITHNLIFLPFSLLLCIYITILIGLKPVSLSDKLKNILPVFYHLLLGFGLTTFFWLPALSEKQHTLVDNILLTEKYTYFLHYLKPSQLWNSLWGYGGSAPPGEIDGFTMKIGKLHIVTSLVAFLLSLLALKFTRVFKPISASGRLIFTLFILLVTSAFFTTSYSNFVWDNLTVLQYLQFPWRFLTFTALFSSVIAAGFLFQISRLIRHRLIHYLLFTTLTLLLLLPNIKMFQPQTYLDVTDSYYLTDEFLKWKISSTSFEFVPKHVATIIHPESGITQLDITRDQIATTTHQIISGDPDISTITSLPHLYRFSVASLEPSTIRINSFYFPGWHATYNNQILPISSDNPLHLIEVHLPPGVGELTLTFTHTPVRFWSNIISIIFLAIIFIYYWNSYQLFPFTIHGSQTRNSRRSKTPRA